MRLQAISMPRAYTNGYITKNNSQSFKASNNYVAVPASNSGETFITWAAKSVLTASLFSLTLDLGNNFLEKNVKSIKGLTRTQYKDMPKNALKAAGIFMLIGAIFQGVSNIVDKKLK